VIMPRISQLTELTSITPDDLMVVVDDPSSNPVTKKITVGNFLGVSEGYIPYRVTGGGLANSPIYTDGTNVGIGTTTPWTTFNVKGYRAVFSPDTESAFDLDLGGSTASSRWRMSVGANFRIYDNWDYTNQVFTIARSGNVGIATTSPGGSTTVGTRVLSIANGTEPVGGVADQVSLFSKDVSASAELFVMDEAGNKTQLSPHPTDFLDTLPVADRPFPWAYRSENEYLGKRISVDLAGLVAAVEQLTGKKFMFIEDIPQRSWDEDQEAQRLAREKEIQNTLQQIADLEQKIEAEEDEDKKQELIKQKEAIVVPEPYVKKEPPKWIADRLKQKQMSEV